MRVSEGDSKSGLGETLHRGFQNDELSGIWKLPEIHLCLSKSFLSMNTRATIVSLGKQRQIPGVGMAPELCLTKQETPHRVQPGPALISLLLGPCLYRQGQSECSRNQSRVLLNYSVASQIKVVQR